MTDNLRELEKEIAVLAKRKTENKLKYYRPYPKQEEFHALSRFKRERLLMAGNQLGKTYSAAAEVAMHLTGEYPWWWDGRVWETAVTGWAAGETSTVVRNTIQKLLCGEPGSEEKFGSGLIPKKSIIGTSPARGVADAYDTIRVRHKSGGVSILRFKSYEQGRTKFQGDTLDFLWLDEEPDLGIYSECLARMTATSGMLFMTFTPLKGMSDVVIRFTDEQSEDREIVRMGMNDVPSVEDGGHIPEKERASIIAGYPAHEREARANGEPLLGSGRIFTLPEDRISEPAIPDLPPHWPKIRGLDFGIDHPFAAADLAWDRDADVVHLYAVYRVKGASPLEHAAALKPRDLSIPTAWPHDGHVRDKGSGVALAKTYRKHGFRMLGEHAKSPDGKMSVEAALVEWQERMATGRFKVAEHLQEFWDEYKMYHRKDGLIVKERDDLISAVRYALMMLRYAQVIHPNDPRNPKVQPIATGMDYDILGF